MIVRKKLDLNKPVKLTKKQIKELEKMEASPIVYDEDCPPLTKEELSKMYRVSEIRREERRKETVSIRLSSKALKKARSLGKGYTSILSRILEDALNDNETIKKYL